MMREMEKVLLLKTKMPPVLAELSTRWPYASAIRSIGWPLNSIDQNMRVGSVFRLRRGTGVAKPPLSRPSVSSP